MVIGEEEENGKDIRYWLFVIREEKRRGQWSAVIGHWEEEEFKQKQTKRTKELRLPGSLGTYSAFHADGDKWAAPAVRALPTLGRFVDFQSVISASGQNVQKNTFLLTLGLDRVFLVVMNATMTRKTRWCWRKDLAEFRGLTDRERAGFLLVLEWFENFRLRHELPAGREAAKAFWKSEVTREDREREAWQLEQWGDAAGD